MPPKGPPPNLSLKLPPRPEDPETREYYARKLQEARENDADFADYESTVPDTSRTSRTHDDVFDDDDDANDAPRESPPAPPPPPPPRYSSRARNLAPAPRADEAPAGPFSSSALNAGRWGVAGRASVATARRSVARSSQSRDSRDSRGFGFGTAVAADDDDDDDDASASRLSLAGIVRAGARRQRERERAERAGADVDGAAGRNDLMRETTGSDAAWIGDGELATASQRGGMSAAAAAMRAIRAARAVGGGAFYAAPPRDSLASSVSGWGGGTHRSMSVRSDGSAEWHEDDDARDDGDALPSHMRGGEKRGGGGGGLGGGLSRQTSQRSRRSSSRKSGFALTTTSGGSGSYTTYSPGRSTSPSTPSTRVGTPGRIDTPETPKEDAFGRLDGRSTDRSQRSVHLATEAQRMTDVEITKHYDHLVRSAMAVNGGVHPHRLRKPETKWNGDQLPLCKLTAPGGRSDAAAEGEDDDDRRSAGLVDTCYLSRNYTEGMKAPTAFATPPPTSVLCNLCKDVAWEPVVDLSDRGANGRGVVCRNCLCAAKGISVGQHAPDDPQTTRAIAGLRVLCRHALRASKHRNGGLLWRLDRGGCPDQGRLVDRKSTEKDCAYEITICGFPNNANPAECCPVRIRRREVQDHRTKCDRRAVSCVHPGCHRKIMARYSKNHAKLCDQRPFECPTKKCTWRGKRIDADAHLETCPHEQIVCGFIDDAGASYSTRDGSYRVDSCGVVLPRRKMKAHKAVCQYQPTQCKWCHQHFALRRAGAHEAKCNDRFFSCARCGMRVHVTRRDAHDATSCPEVAIECGYARYGCAHRTTRAAFNDHVSRAVPEHLRLLLTHIGIRRGSSVKKTPAENDALSTTPSSGGGGGEREDADGLEAMRERHVSTRADLHDMRDWSAVVADQLRKDVEDVKENAAEVEDRVMDALRCVLYTGPHTTAFAW